MLNTVAGCEFHRDFRRDDLGLPDQESFGRLFSFFASFFCPALPPKGLSPASYGMRRSEVLRTLAQPPFSSSLCASLSASASLSFPSRPLPIPSSPSHSEHGQVLGEFQVRQDDSGNGLFKASCFGLEYPDPGLQHLCFASSSSP